jgi:surfeit locus 1 family protein
LSLSNLPESAPKGKRFWLVTAAAVTGIATTAALGNWQLMRAAQKQGLFDAIEAKRKLEPLDLSTQSALKTVANEIHRNVIATGQWLPAHQVFLDNRQMNGRPGFFVMTPFALASSSAVVLVQRGWVPRNFIDRSALPVVPTPQGTVSLQAVVALAPSRLFEFEPAGVSSQAATAHAGGASHIRQNLSLSAFASETGLALLPITLVQTTGAPGDGLKRDWPAAKTGIEKHHGYAFQWFGLSALITTLYVWFQLIAPRRRPQR